MIEKIDFGEIKTQFMRFGDEAFVCRPSLMMARIDGPFGVIEEKVIPSPNRK
ncbi:hypothetical protein P4S72_06000 [Vibrio sp. PP-XX7]